MAGGPARIGSVENRRIIILLLDLLGLQRRAAGVCPSPRYWVGIGCGHIYIRSLSRPSPLSLSPVQSIPSCAMSTNSHHRRTSFDEYEYDFPPYSYSQHKQQLQYTPRATYSPPTAHRSRGPSSASTSTTTTQDNDNVSVPLPGGPSVSVNEAGLSCVMQELVSH